MIYWAKKLKWKFVSYDINVFSGIFCMDTMWKTKLQVELTITSIIEKYVDRSWRPWYLATIWLKKPLLLSDNAVRVLRKGERKWEKKIKTQKRGKTKKKWEKYALLTRSGLGYHSIHAFSFQRRKFSVCPFILDSRISTDIATTINHLTNLAMSRWAHHELWQSAEMFSKKKKKNSFNLIE